MKDDSTSIDSVLLDFFVIDHIITDCDAFILLDQIFTASVSMSVVCDKLSHLQTFESHEKLKRKDHEGDEKMQNKIPLIVPFV